MGPPPRRPLPRLRRPPRPLGLPSMAGQGGERPLPPGPEPPGLSAPLDAPDLPDTGGRGRGFWYGLVPLWGEAVGLGNGGGDAAGPEAAGRGKAFGPQAAGEPGLPVEGAGGRPGRGQPGFSCPSWWCRSSCGSSTPWVWGRPGEGVKVYAGYAGGASFEVFNLAPHHETAVRFLGAGRYYLPRG